MSSSAREHLSGDGQAVKDAAQQKRAGESARRALAILLSFSKERHTLTARELAQATGIPLPSIYRYVTVLREFGVVGEDNDGRYRLTARVLPLAQAAESAEDIVAIADPVMTRLAADTGEAVILVRLAGSSAVCIHRIESGHRLRVSFDPGQAMPLEHGATARLLLASMPDADRRALLAGLARRDRRAWTALEREVKLARERGWATSEEEIERGVWAAAAAIRPGSETVGVISVPSPLARAREDKRQQVLDQVLAAASEISSLVRKSSDPVA